jgi:hypothetical protein
MKKRFIPQTKSASKQEFKYRVKDRSKLVEILSVKHGWQPAEVVRYLKNGRIVLKLLFSNQIIVRKIGKRMRPYQYRKK